MSQKTESLKQNKSANARRESGFTIIDAMLIMGICLIAFLLLLRLDDINEASQKKNCWQHQEFLQEALTDLLMENEMDLFQVFAAYTIYDPNAELPYKLVVVIHPTFMDYTFHVGKTEAEAKKAMSEMALEYPAFLVKDLTDRGDQLFCPSRNKNKTAGPVMDYWYMPMQRWYCLNSKYHN